MKALRGRKRHLEVTAPRGAYISLEKEDAGYLQYGVYKARKGRDAPQRIGWIGVTEERD
jgi:hypothetical protein